MKHTPITLCSGLAVLALAAAPVAARPAPRVDERQAARAGREGGGEAARPTATPSYGSMPIP